MGDIKTNTKPTKELAIFMPGAPRLNEFAQPGNFLFSLVISFLFFNSERIKKVGATSFFGHFLLTTLDLDTQNTVEYH